jgi:hypothetical protein
LLKSYKEITDAFYDDSQAINGDLATLSASYIFKNDEVGRKRDSISD